MVVYDLSYKHLVVVYRAGIWPLSLCCELWENWSSRLLSVVGPRRGVGSPRPCGIFKARQSSEILEIRERGDGMNFYLRSPKDITV